MMSHMCFEYLMLRRRIRRADALDVQFARRVTHLRRVLQECTVPGWCAVPQEDCVSWTPNRRVASRTWDI